MRLAAGIDARHGEADALAFENRKRQLAEIKYDMPNVRVRCSIGQPEVSSYRSDRGFATIVEIDGRLAGGMRCDRLAAEPLTRFFQ